jgi:hypothetical protein
MVDKLLWVRASCSGMPTGRPEALGTETLNLTAVCQTPEALVAQTMVSPGIQMEKQKRHLDAGQDPLKREHIMWTEHCEKCVAFSLS